MTKNENLFLSKIGGVDTSYDVEEVNINIAGNYGEEDDTIELVRKEVK